MSSVFADAMGSDFARLHPQLQRRFGVSSTTEHCVGTGVMDRIWRGPAFTVPFLRVGAWRSILVPATGTDVPFTVEDYAYVDGLGRETVTVNRTFELPRGRRARFDATVVRHPETGRVLDYLGTHQHLAVDLDLTAEPDGSLTIRSGEQRCYERRLGARVPELLTGHAELHERFDDATGRFRITVVVRSQRFGPLCGYEGSFTCRWLPVAEVPATESAKPRREEARV